MTQAELMVTASCDESLDLAAFNEAHGNPLRSAAAAMEQCKKAQRWNCCFNRAIVVMMVTTGIACFDSLPTMPAR